MSGTSPRIARGRERTMPRRSNPPVTPPATLQFTLAPDHKIERPFQKSLLFKSRIISPSPHNIYPRASSAWVGLSDSSFCDRFSACVLKTFQEFLQDFSQKYWNQSSTLINIPEVLQTLGQKHALQTPASLVDRA